MNAHPLVLALSLALASSAFADTYQIRIPAAIDPQVAASLETPGQAKLSLSPGTYDFGGVPLEQSGRYTFNLSNVGDKAAYLSFSSLSAPFSLTHDCPAWLSESGACSFAVEFAPGTTGQVSASLTINGGIGAQHAGLSLSGTGLPRLPDPAALSATPGVLEFEPTFTTLTRTATLTLTNVGESTAQLQLPFGASGPFAFDGTTCAVTLAPGASCQVSYRFAPQAAGPVEATVMLQADDPATPATLTLRGEGMMPGVLSPSASTLDFGNVKIGATKDLALVLTNSGATALALPETFTFEAPYMLQSEDCTTSLAPAATCTLNIRFAPTAEGAVAKTLSVPGSTAVSAVNVALTGVGQKIGIVASGDVRAWEDGSVASSCNEYLTALNPYSYAGATGSGVYRVDPDGAGAQPQVSVYCDMDTDGGGWMLLSNFGRNANTFHHFMNAGGSETAALSPVNHVGVSGSVGLNRWEGSFNFNLARIELVAGDNPSQVAKFYKTVTFANMAAWSNSGMAEPNATKTCTNLSLTENCTTKPFDFIYFGAQSDRLVMHGVDLRYYGYLATSDIPVHGYIDRVHPIDAGGFCSVTGNNPSWQDSYYDGHWGNGLRIWMK